MDRRTLLKVTTGVVASGAMARAMSVAAQDATPSDATPTAETLVSFTESDGSFVITHPQGEATVTAEPSPVVSYDLASVDTLQTLGIKVDGLPTLAGNTDQINTEDTESVGTMQEPDFEAVAGLGPELILIGGRTLESFDQLNDIAPTVDMSFQGQDVLANLTAQASLLGSLFGKQDDVASRLDEIEDRIAVLKEQAAGVSSGLLILVNAGTVTALAPNNARGGRGALIYSVLGIKPPVDDLDSATHGEPISFEFLLEHDPEYLFVIDRDAALATEGAQPAAEVLDNEIIHQTSAWKNDKIVYLNPFDWYVITGAGLTSINRQIDELSEVFG